jgi:hypothetical protein
MPAYHDAFITIVRKAAREAENAEATSFALPTKHELTFSVTGRRSARRCGGPVDGVVGQMLHCRAPVLKR